MEKKIKVCHITSVHPRYDTRIFYKECTSLSKAGYDVTLLVADGLKDEVVNNVHIHTVGKRPLKRIRRMLFSKMVMCNAAMTVNALIYHLHDPELLQLAHKLNNSGKLVIFDSHENYPQQIATKPYLPKIVSKLVSHCYKIYETQALKHCACVIVPCTFNDGVDIFEGRCKKVESISNAPLLEEFYNKYDDDVPVQHDAICHVGGLTFERGITHLIQAAYKAGEKLILAGKFSPHGYLENLKTMNEFQCVDYRGFKTREELVSLYEESSIGMANILNVGQYNTGDNFATKVYEYMSMGLPVILSKYPFAEKMLKKYEFGIAVDPANIDEIASAIRYLRENPNKAKQMGENGRRAVLEEFNWGIEEKKLLKLYEDLLNA